MIAALREHEIEQAAIEAYGCHSAREFHQRDWMEYRAEDAGRGEWHCLSVQREAGGDFEVVGRRRTRAELLTLALRGHIDLRGKLSAPRIGRASRASDLD